MEQGDDLLDHISKVKALANQLACFIEGISNYNPLTNRKVRVLKLEV